MALGCRDNLIVLALLAAAVELPLHSVSMTDVVPDLIEPLRAWRAWSVRRTDEGWRLASIHYQELWPTGRELSAWCFRSSRTSVAEGIRHARHHAPSSSCHCGIYGAADPLHAGEYLIPQHTGWETMYVASSYVHRVFGQIDLWGRLVECEQGYRATHGYPARVFVPTRRPDGSKLDVSDVALDLLAYGVPVELVDAGARDEILGALEFA